MCIVWGKGSEAVIERKVEEKRHIQKAFQATLPVQFPTTWKGRTKRLHLSSEGLRQEVQGGLNVVESWNSANSFIFHGKSGEMSFSISKHELHNDCDRGIISSWAENPAGLFVIVAKRTEPTVSFESLIITGLEALLRIAKSSPTTTF